MTGTHPQQRLAREYDDSNEAAPVSRIVHLGLGAFHRAHQAWYTAHAADAADWEIVAFTGRNPQLAVTLAAQDGLYTLIERASDGDRFELISSIVRVYPGSEVELFVEELAAPEVKILTLTITEAGYCLDEWAELDEGDPGIAHDVEVLKDRLSGRRVADWPQTALGKVLIGLDLRRRRGLPPLAIVPCDNIPDNGAVTARALHRFAALVSRELELWLTTGVSLVSTSVDRITPKSTPADSEIIREKAGYLDQAPVVTEPFSDWVLSGEFPSGRPSWESAGARFVEEIAPWEARKLWLLNGAHTILAMLGLLRGHFLVAEAIADVKCRDAVETWWDESSHHLPDLDTGAYREALVARFSNPRIQHRLEQIAMDSTTKIRHRIVPVALAERAAGRSAAASALAIAAWIRTTTEDADAGPDAGATGFVRARIAEIDQRLAADPEFVRLVEFALRGLCQTRPST